jgi:hypothetical protein
MAAFQGAFREDGGDEEQLLDSYQVGFRLEGADGSNLINRTGGRPHCCGDRRCSWHVS